MSFKKYTYYGNESLNKNDLSQINKNQINGDRDIADDVSLIVDESKNTGRLKNVLRIRRSRRRNRKPIIKNNYYVFERYPD